MVARRRPCAPVAAGLGLCCLCVPPGTCRLADAVGHAGRCLLNTLGNVLPPALAGLSAGLAVSHLAFLRERRGLEEIKNAIIRMDLKFDRRFGRLEERLDSFVHGRRALAEVLRLRAPFFPRVAATAERRAAARMPPAADEGAPGVVVVLMWTARPLVRTTRRFGWAEPARRLREWAEACAPGALVSPPQMTITFDQGSEPGVPLDDSSGKGVGDALGRSGSTRRGLAYITVA